MLSCALAITACKKDDGPSKAELRAEAKQVRDLLAKYKPIIEAAGKRARAAAKVGLDDKNGTPIDRPPIKLFELDMNAADSNADVLFADEVPTLKRGILGSCISRLAREVPSAYILKDILPRCARTRYLLLVKPEVYVKPRITTAGIRKYSGGTIRAHVFVYDIAKPGGGDLPWLVRAPFLVEAKLTETVRVRESETKHTDYTLNEALRKVLLKNIAKKLSAAAAKPKTRKPTARVCKQAPGWRYERIKLPPEFAPKMPPGSEELFFAPGMFKPKAPDYFSYVFSLAFDKVHKWNAKIMRKLLNMYYRGLIGAVGKSKKVQVDLGKIDSNVAMTPAGFTATVSLVDTFTTNKPLALRMKITVRGACLQVSASPARVGKPVWKQLARAVDCVPCPKR